MGKQINFLMDKELEQEFFEFVNKSAVVLFEDDNGLLEAVDVLPSSDMRYWWSLYIYNEKFGDYTLNDLDNGKVYLDLDKSPVIEFNRTIIRENTKDMSRGRLWFQNSYWDDEDKLVYKDPNLDKLYQKLCRWIRRNTPKVEVNAKNGVKKEYISKSLIDLIESGYKIY